MANDWSVDVQVNGSETFAAKMEFLNKQLKMFSSVLAESAASMGKNAASVQDLLVKKQMLRNSIAVEQTAQEALREEYDRQSKKLEEQKKKYKELSETVAAGSDESAAAVNRAEEAYWKQSAAVSALRNQLYNVSTNIEKMSDEAAQVEGQTTGLGAFKTAIQHIADQARNGETTLGKFVAGAKNISAGLKVVGKAASGIAGAVGGAFQGIAEVSKKFAENFMDAEVIAELNGKKQELFRVLGDQAAPIAEVFSSSMESAKPAISQAINGLFSGDEVSGDALTSSLTGMFDGMIGGLTQQLPTFLNGLSGVLTSLMAALAAVLPSLTQTLLPAVMTALVGLVSALIGQLPALLPALLGAGLQLFLGLIQGLNQVVPLLMEQLPLLISSMSMVLLENIPQIISAGIQLLTGLVAGIAQSVPLLVGEILLLIPTVVASLIANLPALIIAGMQILLGLIEGIVQTIPVLIEQVIALIPVFVETLMQNLPAILSAGLEILLSLVAGIVQALPMLINSVVAMIPMIVKLIMDNLPQIIQAGIQILTAVTSGLVQAIPQLVGKLPEIIGKIVSAFANTNWLQVGIDLIKGIGRGLANAGGILWDMAKEACANVLKKIKGFFGIHSPSKVFRDQVGMNLAKGLGIGFLGEMDRVGEQMKNAIPTRFSGIVLAGGISPSTLAAASAGAPGGVVLNQTVNNYSPKALSPAETARLNRNAMRQMVMGVKFA